MASDDHPTSRNSRSVRMYRVALTLSVILNVALVAAIWSYIHFEGTLNLIDTVVGLFD